MFTPIQTNRLVLRPFTLHDVDSVHARRNAPQVARYQSWTLPYSRERAEELVRQSAKTDSPADDDWYGLAVDELTSGATVGDLAIRLSWAGRTAEIGYTFGPAHWGKGYATEAVTGLLTYLFEVQSVTRVQATTHPDNRSSHRVAERAGFVFEGRTRRSYWVGDENSDDIVYGLLRDDWQAWRSRNKNPPNEVRLTQMTPDNRDGILNLQTHRSQELFVPKISICLVDALIPPPIDGLPRFPWFRGVLADGKPVGFVMVLFGDDRAESILSHFMVDRMHQRRGIGRRVLNEVVAICSKKGCSTLTARWTHASGSPELFFTRCGFERLGDSKSGGASDVTARLRVAEHIGDQS